jgi:hypothetical protein
MKIGILLNSPLCSSYAKEFIDWCDAHEAMNTILYMQAQKPGIKNSLYIFCWKLIQIFENPASLFSKKSTTNISNLTKNFENIKYDDLDLLITFDFKETILPEASFSKNGLIFFHSDININKRLGPLGFDEVLNHRQSTSFSILHFSGNESSYNIIFEGAFPTSKSFSRNIKGILERRNFYLKNVINRFIDSAILNNDFQKIYNISADPFFPILKDQIRYISHLFTIARSNLYLRYINPKQSIFEVYYSRTNWQKLNQKKSIPITNPVNGYFADPFLIDQGPSTYCFMENFNFESMKGSIAVCELNEDTYTYLGDVLEEAFHLSFPYLFKYQSKIYMVPESCQNKDIRLYECISFPNEWKLKKIIFQGVEAVDSMIFAYEGKWWLFTNMNPNKTSDRCSELFIFYSDNPIEGDWKPHSENPVIVNSQKGRNGGLIQYKEDLFRVSQKQGYGEYGVGFEINKIIHLTENIYHESLEKDGAESLFSDMIKSHHLHSNNKYTVFDRWDYKKIK